MLFLHENLSRRVLKASTLRLESVVDNGWRNWNHPTLLERIWNGSGTVEKSLTIPKKIKYNVYNWANPLSIYRREMKTGTQMNTYSRIFIAALFTIAEQWKQPIKGWMDRQIITMECYSVRKIHGTIWMNPENMPSERS